MANALESMLSGGSLSVAARSRAREMDRSVVELVIEDTGEGIPACALRRVVEPFFTIKAGGTGLGLAIAKRFVEQNKGEFVISSVEQKGTVVTVALPVLRLAGESLR